MPTERYQSREALVNLPAAELYTRMSDLSNFTPVAEAKLDGWEATADTCTFRAQGFTIRLRVSEREPDRRITVVPEGATPFSFILSCLLEEKGPALTGLTVVLEIELSMILKMMVGERIQKAMDSIPDMIAQYHSPTAPR